MEQSHASEFKLKNKSEELNGIIEDGTVCNLKKMSLKMSPLSVKKYENRLKSLYLQRKDVNL